MVLSRRVLKGTIISTLFITALFLFQAYAGANTAVKAVKPAEVCMVNNTFMGKPQILVKFEGKTYYGCCEGCVARIKGERAVRYSVDPVTGREVDKSKAFITAAPDGGVLYFESSATATRYYSLNKAGK